MGCWCSSAKPPVQSSHLTSSAGIVAAHTSATLLTAAAANKSTFPLADQDVRPSLRSSNLLDPCSNVYSSFSCAQECLLPVETSSARNSNRQHNLSTGSCKPPKSPVTAAAYPRLLSTNDFEDHAEQAEDHADMFFGLTTLAMDTRSSRLVEPLPHRCDDNDDDEGNEEGDFLKSSQHLLQSVVPLLLNSLADPSTRRLPAMTVGLTPPAVPSAQEREIDPHHDSLTAYTNAAAAPAVKRPPAFTRGLTRDSFLLNNTTGCCSGYMMRTATGKGELLLQADVNWLPFQMGNPLQVQIGELLGRGGCGSVYSGQWRGRPIAVKVVQQVVAPSASTAAPQPLSPALNPLGDYFGSVNGRRSSGDGHSAAVQSRAPALPDAHASVKRLRHPNIVRTYAYAVLSAAPQPGGVLPARHEHHVVLELCDGGSLRGWLDGLYRVGGADGVAATVTGAGRPCIAAAAAAQGAAKGPQHYHPPLPPQQQHPPPLQQQQQHITGGGDGPPKALAVADDQAVRSALQLGQEDAHQKGGRDASAAGRARNGARDALIQRLQQLQQVQQQQRQQHPKAMGRQPLQQRRELGELQPYQPAPLAQHQPPPSAPKPHSPPTCSPQQPLLSHRLPASCMPLSWTAEGQSAGPSRPSGECAATSNDLAHCTQSDAGVVANAKASEAATSLAVHRCSDPGGGATAIHGAGSSHASGALSTLLPRLTQAQTEQLQLLGLTWVSDARVQVEVGQGEDGERRGAVVNESGRLFLEKKGVDGDDCYSSSSSGGCPWVAENGDEMVHPKGQLGGESDHTGNYDDDGGGGGFLYGVRPGQPQTSHLSAPLEASGRPAVWADATLYACESIGSSKESFMPRQGSSHCFYAVHQHCVVLDDDDDDNDDDAGCSSDGDNGISAAPAVDLAAVYDSSSSGCGDVGGGAAVNAALFRDLRLHQRLDQVEEGSMEGAQSSIGHSVSRSRCCSAFATGSTAATTTTPTDTTAGLTHLLHRKLSSGAGGNVGSGGSNGVMTATQARSGGPTEALATLQPAAATALSSCPWPSARLLCSSSLLSGGGATATTTATAAEAVAATAAAAATAGDESCVLRRAAGIEPLITPTRERFPFEQQHPQELQGELDMGITTVLLNRRAVGLVNSILRAAANAAGGGDSAVTFSTEPMSLSHLRHLVTALGCLADIAAGLSYLHGIGMVHGDVKSGNVLLKKDPRHPRGFVLKLADFGFSRVLEHDSHIYLSRPSGTLAYLSPEMLTSYRQSAAADQYAFGLLMWEVVTTCPLFKGLQTPQLLFSKTHNSDWQHLVWPPWCPGKVRAMARRCTEYHPEARITSGEARVLLDSLRMHYEALLQQRCSIEDKEMAEGTTENVGMLPPLSGTAPRC